MLRQKICRTVSVLLAILMLLPNTVILAETLPQETQMHSELLQVGVNEETEEYYLIQYEEVASNDDSILYADMKRGFFALKHKASGAVWHSTPVDSLLDEYTIGLDKWAFRSQVTIGIAKTLLTPRRYLRRIASLHVWKLRAELRLIRSLMVFV